MTGVRKWTVLIGGIVVTAGVGLHLPMYLGQSKHGYVLNGMGWDRWMAIGMALIVGGTVAVLWALLPRAAFRERGPDVVVEMGDDGPLGARHLALFLTLTLAIAIDAAKPFTFAFILPGVAKEYGLSTPAHHVAGALPAGLYPLASAVGLVTGALVLGRLADVIGRRSLILITSTLFIGTSACGGMPAYGYNLVMCLVMGFAVGGLLPIASSLLAETIPARHRGAAIVLVVGCGTGLGFVLISWLAHLLVPILNWRILWFTSAPMGLVLILLNHFIPESPRYLLSQGRVEEAHEVALRFGGKLVERPRGHTPEHGFASNEQAPRSQLLRGPLLAITSVLGFYGAALGIVQVGFITWLPIDAGSGHVASVTSVLADAALFALPASMVVAWLYTTWSSKGALAVTALVMAASLVGFAAAGNHVADHRVLFLVLVSALLSAVWGSLAALLPYAAEAYPTRVRSAGTGLIAAMAKAGGVVVLAMSAASITPPDLTGSAVLGAVPILIAGLLLLRVGPETSGRRLEDISPAVLLAQEERQSA